MCHHLHFHVFPLNANVVSYAVMCNKAAYCKPYNRQARIFINQTNKKKINNKFWFGWRPYIEVILVNFVLVFSFSGHPSD
jgi:hypothetical protein